MAQTNRLAIEGGEPLCAEDIPYHRPSLGRAEKEAAAAALDSGYVVGPGPYCEEVEAELEKQWSTARALTTTSCTHALELALLCLELDPADEVIVPAFTYVSTALAVIRAGGTPVFADVDPDTLTLTPKTIEPARTPQTVGVVMVHYGGYPGPIDGVASYCRENNLDCVEDAAQAYDSSLHNQQAGTFGRFGALSFHGTKSLTSGEGGLVLVNNEADVKRAEMIRDKGTDRSVTCRGDVDRYTWRSTGSSYVLSDILAAVLRAQMDRWPEIKAARLNVREKIIGGLREVDKNNYFEFQESPAAATTNGHITAFRLPDPGPRDWLLTALQAEGIEVREHYHPLHLSPYARNNLEPPDSLPNSETVAATLVRVPAHPELEAEEIEAIFEGFRKVYPALVRRLE